MTSGELKSRDIRATLEVMKVVSKLLALLMIATLAFGCCAAHVGPAAGQFQRQSQMPSGCHEHSPKAPARAPNHDCCLTGHDAAIAQVYPLGPLDTQSRWADTTSRGLQSTTDFVSVHVDSANLSPTPPGVAPLRI
jgi:hypothetical protein